MHKPEILMTLKLFNALSSSPPPSLFLDLSLLPILFRIPLPAPAGPGPPNGPEGYDPGTVPIKVMLPNIPTHRDGSRTVPPPQAFNIAASVPRGYAGRASPGQPQRAVARLRQPWYAAAHSKSISDAPAGRAG